MSLDSLILKGCLSSGRRFLIDHREAKLLGCHDVLRLVIRDGNFRRCITHWFVIRPQ